MCSFLFLITLIAVIVYYVRSLPKKAEIEAKKQEKIREINRHAKKLATLISKTFLVKNCSKCHEVFMSFIKVSPNARSVQYKCNYCGKVQRAVASSDNSKKAIKLQKDFDKSIAEYKAAFYFDVDDDEINRSFKVPEQPLPYEQSLREPISESIRTEVWRRDNGTCVKCGSKINLEFDHIIPVSKGGATTARNLQLLCEKCNRSKGAKI